MLEISVGCFQIPQAGALVSLHSWAHAVALSGFTGGEYLPLPRSEGAAFPSLFILEGPHRFRNVAQRQQAPSNMGELVLNSNGVYSGMKHESLV